jgi:hypothetical protein
MNDIKNTSELKKVAEEYVQECPYLINIKKAHSELAEIWDNFCPRGGSVSYFVPDNEETK